MTFKMILLPLFPHEEEGEDLEEMSIKKDIFMLHAKDR